MYGEEGGEGFSLQISGGGIILLPNILTEVI